MKLNLNRRDVLKFAAGGAVGAAMTPAPWKMLDDVAIWSQNWSWIPRPPKGPSSLKETTCALCPAGCPAQARCIGALPVSMRTASAAAPLCPSGLTAHHLPYHPARIARPYRVVHSDGQLRRIPVPLDTVITTVTSAITAARRSSATTAVLDMRPGRSLSWAWQRFLGSVANGAYVPAPGREGANLTAVREMIGSGDAIGFDLDNVRTILSFRAPIASGWGSRRMNEAIREGKVRLIQVEPVRSQTADIAQRWLAAKPGSEAALAYGIAYVLMCEARSALECGGLPPLSERTSAAPASQKRQQAAALQSGGGAAAAIEDSYGQYTPEVVAAITGVPADEIVAAAHELAQNGPSIVVMDEGFGRQSEEAILALNLLLPSSAIIARSELPPPYADEALAPAVEMDRVADASIGLLIVDASAGDVRFPWPVVRRKLRKDALVVAIAPFFAGTVQRAAYVVPSLPSLETLSELPTPFDAPAARLALVPPLLTPTTEAVDPAAFVRQIARAAHLDLPGEWMKSEELVRARVAAIHASRSGSVSTRDGSTKKGAEFASPDELWDELAKGSVWNGVRPSPAAIGRSAADRFPNAITPPTPRSPGLIAVVRTPRDVTATAAVSPVMTKLYQESGLRRPPHAAVINPVTARQLRLAAGMKATLQTDAGAAAVVIATDHAVMPGVVEVTVAPDAVALGESTSGGAAGIIDLFTPDANGAWRTVAARLVEA